MNIELIETRQLADELMRRFDHAVFAGLKVNEALESQYEMREAVGNMRTCQGLAFAIISKCDYNRNANAEVTEGDG